jgi:hypothetical protein
MLRGRAKLSIIWKATTAADIPLIGPEVLPLFGGDCLFSSPQPTVAFAPQRQPEIYSCGVVQPRSGLLDKAQVRERLTL